MIWHIRFDFASQIDKSEVGVHLGSFLLVEEDELQGHMGPEKLVLKWLFNTIRQERKFQQSQNISELVAWSPGRFQIPGIRITCVSYVVMHILGGMPSYMYVCICIYVYKYIYIYTWVDLTYIHPCVEWTPLVNIWTLVENPKSKCQVLKHISFKTTATKNKGLSCYHWAFACWTATSRPTLYLVSYHPLGEVACRGVPNQPLEVGWIIRNWREQKHEW